MNSLLSSAGGEKGANSSGVPGLDSLGGTIYVLASKKLTRFEGNYVCCVCVQ